MKLSRYLCNSGLEIQMHYTLLWELHVIVDYARATNTKSSEKEKVLDLKKEHFV